MNRAVVSMVGILSEDTNRGSFVRDNLGGSVDELEALFMVIDTSNINFAHVHEYARRCRECHHWRLYP
jgi:hypothetical protein